MRTEGLFGGADPVSGKNFEFRREWIRRRMELLASVLGVDVLCYSILSNHMHLILRSRPDVVAAWSDREVAVRWLHLFPGRRLDEQLGEPTESDVTMLLASPERLLGGRQRGHPQNACPQIRGRTVVWVSPRIPPFKRPAPFDLFRVTIPTNLPRQRSKTIQTVRPTMFSNAAGTNLPDTAMQLTRLIKIASVTPNRFLAPLNLSISVIFHRISSWNL